MASLPGVTRIIRPNAVATLAMLRRLREDHILKAEALDHDIAMWETYNE
jgi:hypothetical protein